MAVKVLSDPEKLNRTVDDIKDFRNGVNMILLVGMLEGKHQSV